MKKVEKNSKGSIRLKIKKIFEGEMESGIGGAHQHYLSASNPSMTDVDGSHQHLYIIGNRSFMTDWDGMHQHNINAKSNKTGTKKSTHRHRVIIDADSFLTEEDGSHTHELQVSNTTFNGIHRHTLELLDGSTIESLLPSDVLSKSKYKAKYDLAIQLINVDSTRFPRIEDAIKWIVDNGYDSDMYVPDPTGKSHSFRQLSRDRFIETTLSEFTVADGIKATFGSLKKDDTAHRGYTNDVEYTTFDMLQDRITRGEVLFDKDDRKQMSDLKDEYKNSLSDLRSRLNSMTESIETLIESIKDEDKSKTLDRYKTNYEIIRDELNQIEMTDKDDVYSVDNSNIVKAIEDIEDLVVPVYSCFEGSTYQGFADLLGSFLLTSEKVAKIFGSEKTENVVKKVLTPWTQKIPFYVRKQKEGEEERYIFAEVLIPNDGDGRGVPLEPDAHRDIYSAADVKKAAYSFMEDPEGGNQGFMHKFFMNDDFTLLENFVTKGKTEIETIDGPVKMIKGTWLMGIRINSDHVWKMIIDKEITGLSIGGSAEVEHLE